MGRRERELSESRLRTARRRFSSGTLAEFARLIGYSPSYLSGIELGYLAPSPEVIQAYEAKLGLSSGSLQAESPYVARPHYTLSSPGPTPSSTTTTREQRLEAGRLATYSTAQLLDGMVSLLCEVARSSVEAGTLYLTCRGRLLELISEEGYASEFQALMSQLIQKGWRIKHFLRFDDDSDRALDTLELIFPLIAEGGQYEALYTPSHQVDVLSSEVLLAAPLGGVLLMLGESPSDRSAGLLAREPQELATMLAICESTEEHSIPVFHNLAREDFLGHSRYITQMEMIPGNRGLVADTLNQSSGAQALYDRNSSLAEKSGLRGDELDEWLRLRSLRRDSFERQVVTQPYRDIYPKNAIEHLVRTGHHREGRMPDNVAPLFRTFTPSEVVDKIESTIYNLRRFDRYSVALLDDSEVSLLSSGDEPLLYWRYKGTNAALIEAWTGTSPHNHLLVTTRERSVVNALNVRFDLIWSKIHRRNKEKDFVIGWLESMVEELRFREEW